MKRLIVVLLLLLCLPAVPDAGTAMRLHVLHERPRGVPTQTITVFFWPAPEDRQLSLIADSPDHIRISSVRLYGIESRRQFNFTWRLPRTVIRDSGVEPYTVTAVTMDAEGNITGQAVTKFFVY